MRKTLFAFAVLGMACTLVTGCANTEKKLGRGFTNTMEPIRLGEMRRSFEQAALFHGPDVGYAGGIVSGFSRTMARTGIGIYEIVTCPFPPYDPVATTYLNPAPAYPDAYKPGLVEDSAFATDSNLGFSGGDINPLVPGSRFRIFDTH